MSPPRQQSFLIDTFTILPDFQEDRLRLHARDAAGQVQAIFMTRRLLDRFIPLLGGQAEKRVDPHLPKHVSLAMSQQVLRQERQESACAAVEVAGGAPSWLSTAMQVVEREAGVVWVLKAGEGTDARIFLSHRNMQSVLDILLNSYRALEWSCEKFPGWVLEPASSEVRGGQAVH